MDAPEDYTHFFHGLYYKVGLHGFVFYWSGASGEWQKSDKKSIHEAEDDD